MNPKILYHGTSLDYVENIDMKGIVKMNHDRVFLTDNIHTAYDYAIKRVHSLGSNTFQPVICVVDANQMIADGFNFEYNPDNFEWTVEHVPAHYLLQVAVESEDELEEIENSITLL